jgi:predicted MFS family arabinose efflux permease
VVAAEQLTRSRVPIAESRRDRDPTRSRPPTVVWALAITQTVGYGVLYYAFAVVLTPVAADLQTSATAITGALTLAVIVSAVCAVPVGRWLDRHGGHAMMTTGSILGTLAVAGWSQVHTVTQLYVIFAMIGVASAMVLYEAAFAVLVAILDAAKSAKAILTVTVVAGFASSVFIPLTGYLTDAYGWRTAVLALAGILAAATVPLHALALRPTRESATSSTTDVAVHAAVHDGGFWLITAGFVLHAAALAAVAVHLVTYLVTLGHPASVAALITGLLGILSVTGRLITAGLTRWLPITVVTAAVFGLQGMAVAGLLLTGRSLFGAVACVVMFGLGFGVATIARPSVLVHRYGRAGYAIIAGHLATPTTLGRAGAPLVAASVAVATGYPAVMAGVAAACLIAAACLLAADRSRVSRSEVDELVAMS